MQPRHYHRFYCEENIWWLLEDDCFSAQRAEVAVLANPEGLCVLFNQRAALAPGEPVAWDYHVVAASFGDRGVEVWDLDSALGAPLGAEEWLAMSFPEAERWPPSCVPRFRLLDADEYRATLCSDRSHMLEDGQYVAPPPEWEPIGHGAPTFPELVDLERPGPGVVLSLEELRERWRVPTA